MNILSIKIQFYNNLKNWEDINTVQSKGKNFKLMLTSMLYLDFFLWLNDTRINYNTIFCSCSLNSNWS